MSQVRTLFIDSHVPRSDEGKVDQYVDLLAVRLPTRQENKRVGNCGYTQERVKRVCSMEDNGIRVFRVDPYTASRDSWRDKRLDEITPSDRGEKISCKHDSRNDKVYEEVCPLQDLGISDLQEMGEVNHER